MTDQPSREAGFSLLALAFTFTAFALLGGLLAWLAGSPRLVLRLAAGHAALLPATFLVAWIAGLLCRALRWNLYDHVPWFLGLNLLASGALTAGSLAYAVRSVHAAARHAAGWQ